MAKKDDVSDNKEAAPSKKSDSEDTTNEQMQNSDDEISPETNAEKHARQENFVPKFHLSQRAVDFFNGKDNGDFDI